MLRFLLEYLPSVAVPPLVGRTEDGLTDYRLEHIDLAGFRVERQNVHCSVQVGVILIESQCFSWGNVGCCTPLRFACFFAQEDTPQDDEETGGLVLVLTADDISCQLRDMRWQHRCVCVSLDQT